MAEQDGFIDNPLHAAGKRGNLSWLSALENHVGVDSLDKATGNTGLY